MTKYIVIDESDGYSISVNKYKDAHSMLEGIQHRTLSEIDVYEIAKKVKLEQRPAIILSEDSDDD